MIAIAIIATSQTWDQGKPPVRSSTSPTEASRAADTSPFGEVNPLLACSVTAHVRNESNVALGAASVCIHDAITLNQVSCVATDQSGQGHLEWPCVDPDVMIALASKNGYAQVSGARFPASPHKNAVVELVLFPASRQVQGRVEDIFGGPLNGAWVWAACTGLKGAWEAEVAASAISDDDGRFSLNFTNRCTADKLLVKAEGYANHSQDISKADNEILIKLSPESVIRGTVLSDGQPVESASVTAITARFGESQALRSVSGPDGRFEITGVPPGQWIVEAQRRPLRGAADGVVQVGIGERAAPVTIHLVEMALVRVTLESEQETPCAGGVGSIWPVSDAGLNYGVLSKESIDQSGEILFHGVGDGKYIVRVDCRGYSPLQSAEFQVAAPEHKNVSIPMPPGDTVTGMVISAVGDPVGACSVSVGGTVERCDENGEFEVFVTDATTFPATITANGSNGESASLELSKPTRNITLQFSESVTTRGRVVSSTGIGVRSLTLEGEQVQCSTTDSNGAFTCTHTPPVSREVELTASRRDIFLGQAMVSVGARDAVIITNTADISGQVIRDSGMPVEFANVAVWEEIDGRRASVGSVTADVEGNFVIGGARAHVSHIVTAVAPDGSSGETTTVNGPVTLLMSDPIELAIDVQPCAGSLNTGRATVRAEGKIMPVLSRVFVISGSGKARIALGSVAAGTYDVTVEIPACGTKKLSHSIAGTEERATITVSF
ncbi:PDZ domain protein [Enhygromyxa salina]|uniref:PDZ domain protein n=2 Tax=Enhygromyxa salina TaxID=215803 RepID=A0A0C1ZI31_9BACT|nr:PDZ domain protein [Enhygromyxa salina]